MRPGESVSMRDGHPRILKAIHHMWPWNEATVVTARLTALNDSLDGPRVTISGGTLCTAEIVTRWQAPIRCFFPL